MDADAAASADSMQIETHPWQPFIPDGAKVLIMGTFPPGEHRWCMNFYYPNPINDFWRVMGLLFCGDRDALYDAATRTWREEAIRQLMADNHIALNDTARQVRRTRGNAADKYLEIVTPVPLFDLLATMPDCRAVATTGTLAAQVIAGITNTPVPKSGQMVTGPDGLEIWRMPSTSRAYPMRIDQKAELYGRMLRHVGILK